MQNVLFRGCRRVLVMWVVPVILMVGLSGCEDGGSGSSENIGDNNPDVYLAMGDSITQAGWPAILAGRLGATVHNYSQGGVRSSSGVGAISGLLSRYKPAYVLILYGANDMIHGGDPAQTVANLQAMIGSARANMTIPVIATLTPMTGGHSAYAGAVTTVNGMIRSLASQSGVRLADLERAFGSNASLLQANGLHPTAAGSTVIANTFYGAVR